MIYPENYPEERSDEKSERKVFDFMKKLPSHFDVFYNVKFTARKSGERADYEIDFIVTDLRNNSFNGVACIEVKGGNLKYQGEDGYWTQNGHKLEVAPTDQVISAMHSLIRRYPEVTRKVPFGWMVCFPDSFCPPEDILPNSLSESQVIDSFKLKELIHTLTYYFDRLIDENRTRTGLDIVSYEKHFKSSLTQDCSFVLPLSGKINVDEEVFIRLTKDQFRILNSARENNRLLVKGTAGTGKTLIAREIAQEGCDEGLNVLFLCFNKVLALNLKNYFQNQLKADISELRDFLRIFNFDIHTNKSVIGDVFSRQKGKKENHNIKIETYHSFAYSLIVGADPGWWDKNIRLPDFWTFEVPCKIEELNKDNKFNPVFDIIIIDEGQDFMELWFETTQYFLKESGKFYIFMDEYQNINQACARVPGFDSIPKVRLEENCRNTLSIASKLSDIINYKIKSKDDIPPGYPVLTLNYKNEIDQQTQILREIKTLIDDSKIRPNQILIMLNTDIERSCLSNTRQVAGLPLSRLNDNGVLNNHSIQYTQINTYKGLEADIVFIVDTDKITYDEMVFYTQASRAKHLLYIFEKI